MGTPVEPQSCPINHQSTTWVPVEIIPSSEPAATPNSNYMNHPFYPPTGGATTTGGGDGGGYFHTTTNPYVQMSPVRGSSGNGSTEIILNKLSKCGKKLEDATRKAEFLAGNVWHHLKTGPSVTDAAMARLAQGTKVLAEGGHNKVFQQTFQIFPGENLLKAFACYFSTSSGPVIGTLYISTKRVAFCSDNPLCHQFVPGNQESLSYKVTLQLDLLVAVNSSCNRLNPSEKYIQIVTEDGHEFWFMGFVSYDKALKSLTESLQLSNLH